MIDCLIEIGCSENFSELERIAEAFPESRNGALMRLRPDSWYNVTATISELQLMALIKALTLLEQYPNFKAGSVSPVIWLFRHLPNAHAKIDLINWILCHTDNDYLPFGSSNHGANSLDEYHQRISQFAARGMERQNIEEERQNAAKARKADESSQILFGAIRRKDNKAIAALLARGADRSAVNEAGQTALEYARLNGLGYLFDGTKP